MPKKKTSADFFLDFHTNWLKPRGRFQSRQDWKIEYEGGSQQEERTQWGRQPVKYSWEIAEPKEWRQKSHTQCRPGLEHECVCAFCVWEMFSTHKRPPSSAVTHHTSFICSVTLSRLISIHKSSPFTQRTSLAVQEEGICMKIERGSERRQSVRGPPTPYLGLCQNYAVGCSKMEVSFPPAAEGMLEQTCEKGSGLRNLFLLRTQQERFWVCLVPVVLRRILHICPLASMI